MSELGDEEPLGLDPGEADPRTVRPPLRLIQLSITAREDGAWAVRVMTQSFSREAPRCTLLYEGGHPLPDVADMVQALHTAAEELRLRYRQERAVL